MKEIKYIVVHCTAGSQSQSVADIKAYWKNVLKWRGVGYHYIVEPSGVIEQLASTQSVVNGVKGHNSHAIHIAYIGGIDSKGKACDNRTEAQKGALLDKLRELKAKYPDAEILGHRDLSPDLNGDGIIESHEWIKMCPSFDARGEYASIGNCLDR